MGRAARDSRGQPRQVFNQWPGLRPRAEEVAAQAAQEDDSEHPPGWREAWRALGPPAVLAAVLLPPLSGSTPMEEASIPSMAR